MKQKKILSLLLCLCLAALPAGTCLAATYQVTEGELTKLETVFAELKQTNNVLMQDSTQSQKDLIRALNLLRESQAELKKLQEQLIALRNESVSAREDLKQANEELTKVNKSFRAYEAEAKSKVRSLKAQNVLWMIIAGGAVYWATSK